MNDVEVLEAARALIAPKEQWCQGTQTQDHHVVTGHWFWRQVYEVTQYCAWGALRHTLGDDRIGEHNAVILLGAEIAPRYMPYVAITQYNDHHRHDEVVAMFDRAIAKAKAIKAAEKGKIRVVTHVTERDLAASGD